MGQEHAWTCRVETNTTWHINTRERRYGCGKMDGIFILSAEPAFVRRFLLTFVHAVSIFIFTMWISSSNITKHTECPHFTTSNDFQSTFNQHESGTSKSRSRHFKFHHMHIFQRSQRYNTYESCQWKCTSYSRLDMIYHVSKRRRQITKDITMVEGDPVHHDAK